jgi:hypothetical protein
MAWLNAAPEPRPAKAPPPKPEPISRRRKIEETGGVLPLPDCPSEQLVKWLFEIGPVMSSGMGPMPITWSELKAWQELTGTELEPWEARTLVALSREFAGEAVAAAKIDCPAPFSTELSDSEREKVASAVSRGMRALAASQRVNKTKRKKPTP